MVFRPHPGMERDEVIKVFHQSGIERYTDIDGFHNLGDCLARCSVVMSFYSTVLWEAAVLGLVPFSVHGRRYQRISHPPTRHSI